MFLTKLYSEPAWLFAKPIEFKPGVNFIFAKKIKSDNPKNSLNWLGKSLLLNFIDFCLLSSESKHIKSAKENNDIKDYTVVLEFTIDDVGYIIKRSLEKPNEDILFGKIWQELGVFSNKKWDKRLSLLLNNLIFWRNPEYNGKIYDTWFRSLMSFFVKNQTSKSKVNFSDPINYITGVSEADMIPYHLFFMNVKNTIFYKLNILNIEIKNKKSAIGEIENFIQDSYKLKDIKQAENELDRLTSIVKRDEKNIETFQLAWQYSDAERTGNQLTSEIKDLKYASFIDSKQIQEYKESFEEVDTVNTAKICKIYSELNEVFGLSVKKSLDDAILFRKSIAVSRKEYLEWAIKELEMKIQIRDTEISKLESERIKIFMFLWAKNAIDDLSQAYLDINKRQEKIGDLRWKLQLYKDLSLELSERESERQIMYTETLRFLQENQDRISELRNIFFEIHNAIYPENKDNKWVWFGITSNSRKPLKIGVDINMPKDLAHWKNKAKSLIYDLMILFHAIRTWYKLPRFLIHDWIFDGVDKSHFIALYEYLESQLNLGYKFQYIITLNEEWELKWHFGNFDKVTTEKVEQESIITLDFEHPLLGAHWD